MNSPKNKVSLVEQKAAVQLITSFAGLLKVVPLYPPGHQILLQIIEKFYGGLQNMFANRSQVVIRIFEMRVYVGDAVVEPESVPGVRDLIETLQTRFVRQILLSTGVCVADVSALVAMLATRPEEVAAAGGPAVMLSQRASPAARVVEYYVRRHAEVSQEQLLAITQGEIFRFFVSDTARLTPDQALSLYEMMKDSRLMCELTRIAAHYKAPGVAAATVDPGALLRVLDKIQGALSQFEFSEKRELQEMTRAILTQYDPETLFSLLYDYGDDPRMKDAQVEEKAAGLLKPEELAQLMTAKVSADPGNREVIGHVKNVLERLFLDRQSLLTFLPMFKERLEEAAPKQQAQKMLNEVCAAFAPGFSLEEELDLALGTVNAQEQAVLEEGLQALKSVTIDREELQECVRSYHAEWDRCLILQELLQAEQAPEGFGPGVRRLYGYLRSSLERDDQAAGSEIFRYFMQQMGAESAWQPQHKDLAREVLSEVPSHLLERYIVEALCLPDPQKVRLFLRDMAALLGRKLISLVLKTYTREEELPNRDVLQEFLCLQQETGLMVLDAGGRQETSASAGRILDLLQYMQADQVLPLLWEMTFHEDFVLAQRALKIIAGRNNDASRKMLLKSLQHAQVRVRIAAAELLSGYQHPEVIAALRRLACPENTPRDDRAAEQVRCSAIISLRQLDPPLADQLLRQIRQQKKMFFFPKESKFMRQFAQEQLEPRGA